MKKTPTEMKAIKEKRQEEFKMLCRELSLPVFEKAPAVWHLDLEDGVKLLIYPTTLKWHVSVKGGFVQKEVKHCSTVKQLVNEIKEWVKS